MSFTTAGSISKYDRLMAGTPYWRDRKLVTSSSVRKPSFTSAEPRRQLVSFWTLLACCNCSGVMTFSLTRRSPSRCDIRSISYRSTRPGVVGFPVMCREAACFLGERNGGANRVDTNCQRRRITLKVTLVLDLCGKAPSDENACWKSCVLSVNARVCSENHL